MNIIDALEITIISMFDVFLILTIIILVIYSFKFFNKKEDKTIDAINEKDKKIVALVTSIILAEELGQQEPRFRIKSIKKEKSNA